MRSILVSFLSILIAAQSPQIDTNATYRFTNDYAGAGKSLTVSRSGDTYTVAMADTRNSPDQLWKLVPLGNGKYRLINLTAGDGKSLDTPMSGANYLISMQNSGNYTGQIWTLSPVGNGRYRLTNDYAGPGKSVDTPMSGSQYVMVMADTGNYSGQMWSLTKATSPVASSTVTVQVATPLIIPSPQIIQAPQIDPNATYRVTSDYLASAFPSGPGRSLSVSNNAVVMADTKDFYDQVWKFIPLGGGKYRLINPAVGEGKSLDTQMSGNRYVLSLQNTGSSTGQMWTLTPVGDGKYRLTNDAQGPGNSLNIASVDPSFTQLLLSMTGTANATKQFWTLTKVTPQLVQPAPISININQPAGPPPPRPLTVTGLTWNPTTIPHGTGTMVCSWTNILNPTQCGLTKADWVGSHVLSLNCDKGFYDPIWGGTCWDFPPDNGEGNWVRSTEPVTSDNAVWRVPKPKEYVAKATRVTTGTAFAWDCPSGTFWDIYDRGGCWKCPDKHPRRTAAAVWADNACAASLNETAPAVFLKYNGCPAKVDAATMGLKGKRQPGKPFLQVGSGCYACPSADEDGNILVAQRNGNSITGDAYANNQGCTIVFKWKPPEFPEPGLSGLTGVRETLLDNLLFEDPDLVTAYLTKAAEGLGHKPGTPESIKYVSQQWQEIAASPYKSAAVANLVFGFLELAAATDPTSRTPAEQALVSAVEEYVKLRRTFVAEQALAMYDAWKADDDRRKSQRARSRIEVMGFDYGTVPLDFQAASLAGFGLGVAGAGTIGAIAGANIHAVSTAKTARDAVANLKQLKVALDQARTARDVIEAQRLEASIARALSTAARAQRVANLFTAFRALTMATRIAVMGPAILIEVAGIILTSIAIDQFMQIIEARSKLQAAVEKAKQPVDLKTLLAQPNGKEQLVYFWSKAMDARQITDDGEVMAQARAALEVAKQRGYQLSSGQ